MQQSQELRKLIHTIIIRKIKTIASNTVNPIIEWLQQLQLIQNLEEIQLALEPRNLTSSVVLQDALITFITTLR